MGTVVCTACFWINGVNVDLRRCTRHILPAWCLVLAYLGERTSIGQWIFLITIEKDSLPQIDLAWLCRTYQGFLWERSTVVFSFAYLPAKLI